VNQAPTASIFHHFSTIIDPRLNRQKKHQLQDIFFITLCAVICGADNWVAIEEFGKAKEVWFTEKLNLVNGIPSHDTFGDVFAAIDGKCLRRSIDKASRKAAIYMVSAWAHQNNLVLGQEKVSDKSNEITAIPKLLERLDITGAVVTMDAMGCQKKIAHQIINQQGDCVLSLKGNQSNLHDDVKLFFTSSLSPKKIRW